MRLCGVIGQAGRCGRRGLSASLLLMIAPRPAGHRIGENPDAAAGAVGDDELTGTRGAIPWRMDATVRRITIRAGTAVHN
jgi:hypothetical protein